MKYVYLAGPDVFLENAKMILQYKSQFLRNHGLVPLTPLDTNSSDPLEIYKSNISLIEKCDAVLADLCDFNGTEPDSGTVFEIGYAKALKKIIVTYSNSGGFSYKERINNFLIDYPLYRDHFIPEPFGLKHNLMISKSVDFEMYFFKEAVQKLKSILKKT